MLSTMASFGAGRDSPSPLPLALTLAPAEAHRHQLHHGPFRPRHHSLLQQPPDPYSDPIRRLALARLPPPRRASSSGSSTKPFTSFCIRDILGGQPDRDRDSGSSSSGRPPADTCPASSSSKLITTGTSPAGKVSGMTPGAGKGRAASRSPTTSRASSKSCKTSGKLAPAVPSVSVNGARIVRPWAAPSPSSPDTEISSDDCAEVYPESAVDKDDEEDEEISVDDDEPSPRPRGSKGDRSGVSPLDALMAMTSKTFEGLDAPDSADARRRDQAAMFGKNSTPKKRRKSRTAFSNQQIYELEKRFLYQKYLTPADRDDIAHSLGLTNAQVITWFQNRRAKLKRDLEELKNDVTAARKHPVHKTLIGTVAEMQLRRVHEEVLRKAAEEARRQESERTGGAESVSSPPSSPSSSSAAAPLSCSPSPSFPLTAPGALSPSGSCHSNGSSGSGVSASNVCSLVASNNNHNHAVHSHGADSDLTCQLDDTASSCARLGCRGAGDGEDLNPGLGQGEGEGGSPAGPRSTPPLSPAAGSEVAVSPGPVPEDSGVSQGQDMAGDEEVDMDTSEEPQNLSLKPAKS